MSGWGEALGGEGRKVRRRDKVGVKRGGEKMRLERSYDEHHAT